MAYFPRERFLVEADVFNPGNAVAPFAANLLENVKKRNLRVDRIVPIHSKIAPFAELVKTVGRARRIEVHCRGSAFLSTAAKSRRSRRGSRAPALTKAVRRCILANPLRSRVSCRRARGLRNGQKRSTFYAGRENSA
jgi:hypothetical protein